ncbi:Golgi resident protein GCP60 [Aethina tumida]|uniref:Golgi resident protein GCP60 n=1 Tax=Aethina tumida TaxID=116153 RepID=UPI00214870CE|nr:Golgi resident protein GCP60 [Aethina tumida]
MAAESDSSQISDNFSNLKINTDSTNNVSSVNSPVDTSKYGLPLKEVYRLAYNFYKEKEGKAVHFSYEDKLQLVAFAQQVLHGPLSEAIHKLPPLGTLDVVGKDRRDAWLKLGQLPSEEAREGFVDLLSRLCPLFEAYVEAHRTEIREKERKLKEAEEKRLLEQQEALKKEEEQKKIQEQLEREEAIKRQIQQALNEQTYDQFRKYAEQQYPGDPEKQGALIRQLQEQHYIQYMQQLQAAQRESTQEHITESSKANEQVQDSENTNEDDNEEVTLMAPSMWTRPDVEEFKKTVSEAEGDGVVRVGHGETVTVRVPTHPQGTKLFWEFATDHFDIGFGVFFEFGTPISEQVTVHVSESDEEDMDELDDDDIFNEEAIRTGDLEAGSVTPNGISKPLLTEIVPVYRRDCQTEVYAGSHQYPGKGVYLLKFDNSYSLWRSKTLYYRVYYTQ